MYINLYIYICVWIWTWNYLSLLFYLIYDILIPDVFVRFETLIFMYVVYVYAYMEVGTHVCTSLPPLWLLTHNWFLAAFGYLSHVCCLQASGFYFRFWRKAKISLYKNMFSALYYPELYFNILGRISHNHNCPKMQ